MSCTEPGVVPPASGSKTPLKPDSRFLPEMWLNPLAHANVYKELMGAKFSEREFRVINALGAVLDPLQGDPRWVGALFRLLDCYYREKLYGQKCPDNVRLFPTGILGGMRMQALYGVQVYQEGDRLYRPCHTKPDGQPVFSTGVVAARVYRLADDQTVSEHGSELTANSVATMMNEHAPLTETMRDYWDRLREVSKDGGFNLERQRKLDDLVNRGLDEQTLLGLSEAHLNGTLPKWLDETSVHQNPPEPTEGTDPKQNPGNETGTGRM